MPKSDARDRITKKGSLLSLAGARPSDAEAQAETDHRTVGAAGRSAAERHAVARSRREASRSPLLKALSQPTRENVLPDEASRRSSGNVSYGSPVEKRISRLQELLESPADAETRRDAEAADAEPRRQARPEGPGAAMAQAPDLPAPGDREAGGGDPYWKPLIDPFAVIGGIVKSRYLIVGTTICGAVVGALIALATPKEYQAISELLVDPREIKYTDRELTAGGLPSDATLALVENQVRVILSGTVINKVIDRLGLESDPEYNGEGTSAGIPNPFSGLMSLLRSGGGGEEGNRRAITVENVFEALDAERGGKTFVVSIAAKSESPEKAALIANTVSDVFLETYGELQARTAGRASTELTARLEELRAGVEDAERKVEAFKAQNDIVDAQGRLITDDEIVKLNDQLSVARARTLELNAKAASARSVSVDTILTGNLPEQINSPVLTEMRAQYSTLQQEAERLAARLGPRHPERAAVEAQLESARGQISRELRLVASSIQVDLKRAVQLEQELASRLAQLKARQANLSEELVTLRELEREAAAKRAVYENFLLRAREANEQKAFNAANISVISTATPPLEPSGMSRKTMTVIATMLGFMAGVSMGAVRGAYDSLRASAGAPRVPPPSSPAAVRPASRREAEAAMDDGVPPTAKPAAIPAAVGKPEPLAGRRREPASTDEPARAHAEEARAMAAEGRLDASADTTEPDDETHPAAPAAKTAEEAEMHRMPSPPTWPEMMSPQHQAPAAADAPRWGAPYPSAHYPNPGAAAWPHYPQQMPPAQQAGMAAPYHPAYVQPQPAPYQPAANQAWHQQQGGPFAPAHHQQGPWQQPPAQGPGPHWATPPYDPRLHGWHTGTQPGVHPGAYASPPQPVAHPAPPAPFAANDQVTREARAEARATEDAERSAIEEIRDSLREFKDALRELSESRGRRRFI